MRNVQIGRKGKTAVCQGLELGSGLAGTLRVEFTAIVGDDEHKLVLHHSAELYGYVISRSVQKL